MTMAPNRQSLIQDLMTQGWNHSQANQLAWADFWEYGKDGRGTK